MTVAKHDVEFLKFACICGEQYLARPKHAGRLSRCRKCGAHVLVPSDRQRDRQPERDLPAATNEKASHRPNPSLVASNVSLHCSICQTALEPTDTRVSCEHCGQPFHEDCWQENRGCSTYGCQSVNALQKGPDLHIPESAFNELGSPALWAVPVASTTHSAIDADPNALPWEFVLLAASVLACLLGVFTYGAPPILVAGLASYYRSMCRRQVNQFAFIGCLTICAIGMVLGLSLSRLLWGH